MSCFDVERSWRTCCSLDSVLLVFGEDAAVDESFGFCTGSFDVFIQTFSFILTADVGDLDNVDLASLEISFPDSAPLGALHHILVLAVLRHENLFLDLDSCLLAERVIEAFLGDDFLLVNLRSFDAVIFAMLDVDSDHCNTVSLAWKQHTRARDRLQTSF